MKSRVVANSFGASVLAGFGIFSLVALSQPSMAGAATNTVTNCYNAGSGSLRAVVAAATPGETIRFSVSCNPQAPIKLKTTIDISQDLSIHGPGALSLAVSGRNQTRVFQIEGGAAVSISGLTIEDGSSTNEGGGVLNEGNITLTHVAVSNNTISGNGLGGAGIANEGTMTMRNSTVSGNIASGGSGGGISDEYGTAVISDSTIANNAASIDGGGFCCGNLSLSNSTVADNTVNGNGGGIENGGTLTVSDSTIYGNSDIGGGGAIFTIGGSVTVTASTLSGNSGEEGYGIIQDNCCTVNLAASIVANSTGPDCSGFVSVPVTDDGYNIADDTSCGLSAANNSQSGINPDLGPLRDNGGPTDTLKPKPDSPTLYQIPLGTSVNGITLCPGTDQRGVSRPQSTACDIGSVERTVKP